MNAADEKALQSVVEDVRAFPPLPGERVAALLVAARAPNGAAARDELIHHHLDIALAAATERRDRGVEVIDLYQEGAIAVTVAMTEYVSRSDAPEGLRPYVERVVATHCEDVLEAAKVERARLAALVRDAELFELAKVRLAGEFGRAATSIELAAELGWTEERVDLVAEQVAAAEAAFDAEIVPFLEDEDEAEEE